MPLTVLTTKFLLAAEDGIGTCVLICLSRPPLLNTPGRVRVSVAPNLTMTKPHVP